MYLPTSRLNLILQFYIIMSSNSNSFLTGYTIILTARTREMTGFDIKKAYLDWTEEAVRLLGQYSGNNPV